MPVQRDRKDFLVPNGQEGGVGAFNERASEALCLSYRRLIIHFQDLPGERGTLHAQNAFSRGRSIVCRTEGAPVDGKRIVITGSTRGIGLGLAEAFLDAACRVTISGRSAEAVDAIRCSLESLGGREMIRGKACGVTVYEQVQGLWNYALREFGGVDVWINNAGISHSQEPAWIQPPERMRAIIDTNILGTMHGARVAVAGMLSQGFGAFYNLEGLGSAGRHVPGTSLYGTTKAAVRYFTDALILETRGTPLVIGAIRPGMVMTELVLDQLDRDSKDWPRVERIFNILADNVGTVAPWIASRVLANTKTGTRISWLTRRRALARFALAPFRRRDMFSSTW